MTYKQLQWTDENVAKFWNFNSQFPESYFTYQFGRMIIKKLNEYLKGRNSILDYGCGNGNLIPYLLQYGDYVMGGDYSLESIENVNKRYGQYKNFKGAKFAPDLIKTHSNKFDAIIIVEMIEHLTDEQINQTLGYVKQLLNDDGVVIFTTPNNECLEENHVLCPSCDHVFHRWQHVRNWNKESLPSFLTSSGFKVQTCYTTDFRADPKKILSYVYNRLSRINLSIKGKYQEPHLVCVCKV